jgi:hypothetical protein
MFKFEFKSKEFENMKDFIKRKWFPSLVLVFQPKPGCQPTRPGCLASRVAQHRPPGMPPSSLDQPDPLRANTTHY